MNGIGWWPGTGKRWRPFNRSSELRDGKVWAELQAWSLGLSWIWAQSLACVQTARGPAVRSGARALPCSRAGPGRRASPTPAWPDPVGAPSASVEVRRGPGPAVRPCAQPSGATDEGSESRSRLGRPRCRAFGESAPGPSSQAPPPAVESPQCAAQSAAAFPAPSAFLSASFPFCPVLERRCPLAFH